MRFCRKCNKRLFCWYMIDGKKRNLRNRKFCLDCSPFRKHNTSSILPRPKPIGKKWCNIGAKRQKNSIRCFRERGISRKLEIIKIMGGKCSRCGYDKCHKALSFHHKNPSQKLFHMTAGNMARQSLDIIMIEANKCDLLCLNCHAEVEHEIYQSRKDSNLHHHSLKQMELMC